MSNAAGPLRMACQSKNTGSPSRNARLSRRRSPCTKVSGDSSCIRSIVSTPFSLTQATTRSNSSSKSSGCRSRNTARISRNMLWRTRESPAKGTSQ